MRIHKYFTIKLGITTILSVCFLLYWYLNAHSFEHPGTNTAQITIQLKPEHEIQAVVKDSVPPESLVELSKRIAQLEIEIEQLRGKLRTNPENTASLKNELTNKSEELNELNEKIKKVEGEEGEGLLNEVVSLQEILNLESSIIHKKEEIQNLEKRLEYSQTPEEVVSLILQIEDLKKELGKTEEQLANYDADNKNEEERKSMEQDMVYLNQKIKHLETNLDTTETPDKIVEMVIGIEDKKMELNQLKKGLSAIKGQQAGGFDWEEANEYRIKNLLIYIQKVEKETKDVKQAITAASSPSVKSRLGYKLSLKEQELNELIADLELAGGKYTKPSAETTSASQGISLQSRVEILKQEISQLRSKLNKYDASTQAQDLILKLDKNKQLHRSAQDSLAMMAKMLPENDHSQLQNTADSLNEIIIKYNNELKELNISQNVQELVVLINNKETELSLLENMLKGLEGGSQEEVAWEGKLKYEDHTIASINKFIREVERSIQEQTNIINGNYSSSQKANARSILANKNNELKNLIAELEVAGGKYTPGEVMVDMAVSTNTEEIIEKEPEPLFEKEKTKKKFKKGEKYLLKNVLFSFDKADIQKKSYEELDRLVQLLNDKTNKRVELSGHTDDWGPAAYNQYLSENRAKAVKDYLINKGIDNKRLIAKGYGETKPIAPNLLPNGQDNFEGRKKNRRTEIKVID